MSTDRNIEVAVRKELVSDPLLDANGIAVEVSRGAVSLTGTVPSQAQHVEAAAAARRVAGVTTVDTMLAVALPADDYGDDAALARLANQALAANAVPATVTATARNGNLFLAGTVGRNGQRDAAQDAAAGVAGVFSITNEIDVLGSLGWVRQAPVDTGTRAVPVRPGRARTAAGRRR